MNRPLVFAENKTLFLDTSMTQTAFTKSRMADRLDENGWLAEKTDGGWKFSPWTFSGTRQNECNDENLSPAARRAMETILFEGPAFSGRTSTVSWQVSPTFILGEMLVISTDSTGTGSGGTVTVQKAWKPPSLAVTLITAVPAPMAITVPVGPTVATDSSELSHVTNGSYRLSGVNVAWRNAEAPFSSVSVF